MTMPWIEPVGGCQCDGDSQYICDPCHQKFMLRQEQTGAIDIREVIREADRPDEQPRLVED